MSVYIWGFGKLGQLGFGDRESVFVPKELVICKNGDRPAAIKSGGLFTAIQTRKGDVFVCGCGKYGRLGSGDDKDVLTPIKISPAKDAKVSQIAAGSWHACSVTYLGRLYTWGYNSKHNVLGRDCDKRCSFEPGLVTSLLKTKVKTVSCGHNFTLVSSEDGQVFSWGCGRYGVLGSGGEECVLQPSLISCLAKTKIRTVSAGYAHCGAVSEDGRLFMFGKGSDGALGFVRRAHHCRRC
uniref:RCC1-like domain-containing protein n=1 Tax=Plectus sambesii TaxID=2011161 RepID=A0A914XPZ6_9BILA